MKKIVCDASSIISISDNCLLSVLDQMHDKMQLVISKRVKEELIDKPLKTHRFALKALILRKFLNNGMMEVYDKAEINDYAKRITDLANSLLSYKKRQLMILHRGEAESLACLKSLGENTLLVDERTTRHLIEDPELLQKYMENITQHRLNMNNEVLDELQKELKGINVIRSSELLAYAYEKGMLEGLDSKRVLEAGLYALKFSGCSITRDEIKEYTHLLS